MKYTSAFFCLLLIACLSACTEEPATDNNTTAPSTGISDNQVKPGESNNTATPTAAAKQSTKKHDCVLKEKQLAGQAPVWIADANVLLAIAADESTYDANLGDSYRKLLVYDSEKCIPILSETLPINASPDFPYYLDQSVYNEQSNVVCTQGYEYVFCYDVKDRSLMPSMQPQYLTTREAEDAQSGGPRGLAIQDNYLFGYATDFGSYAFNIEDKDNPSYLLPVAEYQVGQASLYFIQTAPNTYQGIIPVYDFDKNSFSLNTLFDQPKQIDPKISRNLRNNRYLIFNEKAGDQITRIAIDMQGKKLVDLPKDIAQKKTQEILAWLKRGR